MSLLGLLSGVSNGAGGMWLGLFLFLFFLVKGVSGMPDVSSLCQNGPKIISVWMFNFYCWPHNTVSNIRQKDFRPPPSKTA